MRSKTIFARVTGKSGRLAWQIHAGITVLHIKRIIIIIIMVIKNGTFLPRKSLKLCLSQLWLDLSCQLIKFRSKVMKNQRLMVTHVRTHFFVDVVLRNLFLKYLQYIEQETDITWCKHILVIANRSIFVALTGLCRSSFFSPYKLQMDTELNCFRNNAA